MLANILNSIVNNSTEIFDNDKPYSFIKFLNFYDQSIDVKYIINEYNEYIQQWYIAKNNQVDVNLYKQLTQQQYIALLKEITVDYTTAEEKRFLSNIKLSDEIVQDKNKLNSLLDIILPFYIRKINNICKYYLEKRNELKLNVNRLLDINTIEDAKKTIRNLVLDELTTNNAEYSINLDDLDSIKEVLAVDIEELYDNNDYFENNSLSSYNNNDINYKSFYDYDNAIIDAIRQYPFFLLNNDIHAFSVNPKLTINDINYLPVKDFIDNAKTDNTNDVILELQKTLVEKYSGTDYYYLSTNSNNEPVSGLLIKANDSILNILNNDLLNTPTIEYDNYDDIRRIGINFKPDKFGLLFYNSDNLKYEIDTSKLSANSVYVFPNPNKYSKYENSPLIWIIDNDKNKLNYSSQYAYGSPKTDPLIQYFYSYFSIEQQQDSMDKDKIVFHDFEQFIGNKTITKRKFDIYGNEYVLIKDINYINSTSYNNQRNINKILNGNLDNFSYYISLGTNINLSSLYYYILPMGDFGINNFDYETLKYRKFDKCIDGYNINVSLLGLSSYNTSQINWPWPDNNDNISYEVVVDGGSNSIINNNSEGEYTINIPQFTKDLFASYLSSDIISSFRSTEQVGKLYDGGQFYTQENYDVEEIPTINLLNKEISSTHIPSLVERNNEIGECYFKNINTGEIINIKYALNVIFDKYNIENDEILQKIYYELLNKIIDIDIINDVILITTKNYIVYDKLIYDNNMLTRSPYSPSYIDKRNNYIDKPSTYFYVESINKIAYVQLYNYADLYKVDGKYYAPILNLIDLNNLTVDSIKINNRDFVIQNFNWSFISKIIRISTPKLIYNALNDLYNISIICYDYNDLPYLYNISFINKVDYILLYSNTFYETNNNTKISNISKITLDNIKILYNENYNIIENTNGNYIEFE